MSTRIILPAGLSQRWTTYMEDSVAASYTMKVAMNHHSNTAADIEKAKREFWGDLHDIYNLDPDKVYSATYSHTERQVVITEKVDDDE